MLLLLPGLALAFSDTLGGDGVAHDEGEMLKLVSVSVEEAAFVRDLGFAVAGRGVTSEVVVVLYVEVGGAYELVGQASAAEPADGMVGWATAADVDWLLEPGRTYAMGAYVGDGWTYFYEEGRTADPWFGAVTGSYRVEDRAGIPDTFRAE
ncbi:MAG: hypothetical protein ACK4YP_28680, partial [Myxococcota bacterium]